MWLIGIFLPFFTAICILTFGRFLGYKGTRIFVYFGSILTIALNSVVWWETHQNNALYYQISALVEFNLLHISWSFILNNLVSTMVLMVSIIAGVVLIYSCNYMIEDPHIIRFLGYLSLFVFFMLLFISSGNLIQLFLGWEGVGILSYLLINFWFSRIQANKSALKAMFMNKIGDVSLLVSFVVIFTMTKSVEYPVIFTAEPLLFWQAPWKQTVFESLKLTVETTPLSWIIWGTFFLGVMSKSAQLGLHLWLPDAMEGPTPVSSLIHAATMVTAGIFAYLQLAPLLDHFNQFLNIAIFIAALSMLYSALTACVQYDVKKIIAYSTASQLGYMVLALGLSNYTLSFFHLINHAFFKALLFLTAGSLLHILFDEQDCRQTGALTKIIPWTKTLLLIGTLSIIGFPFLTGFYSKDVIIETAFLSGPLHKWWLIDMTTNFAYQTAAITACLTTFYSTRLLYFIFFAPVQNQRNETQQIKESPATLLWPLIILVGGSIFLGYITKDYFIGGGISVFQGQIDITKITRFSSLYVEFIPMYIKILPTLFCIIIFIITLYLYHEVFTAIDFYHVSQRRLYNLFMANINMNLLQSYSWTWLLKISFEQIFQHLDNGVFELIGPQTIGKRCKQITTILANFQNRSLWDYITTVLGATGGLLFIIYFFNAWWSPDILVEYEFYSSQMSGSSFWQSLSFRHLFLNICLGISVVAAILCFWVRHHNLITNLGFFLLTILPNVLILFYIGVEYLALIFLIIYAGAIVILFLFILLMCEPTQPTWTEESYADSRSFSDIFWIVILSLTGLIILSGRWKRGFLFWYEGLYHSLLNWNETQEAIFFAYIGYDITIFGEYFLNHMLIGLWIATIVLFIGMIGSVLITTKPNQKPKK